MLALFRVSLNNATHLKYISKLSLLTYMHTIIPKILYHSTTNQPKITIPERDYSPNSNVARSNWLITKLSKEGKISEARKLFDEMPESDVITWTAVITVYIKCGLIGEARKLFDRVDAKKNVVTWTAMVSGYVRLNRIIEAERLFDEMPVKNVVSWNMMIDGYVRNGKVDKAFEVFEKMPESNVNLVGGYSFFEDKGTCRHKD